MCLSLPGNNDRNRFVGKPPGPFRLLLGTLSFFLVLFGASLFARLRRR